MRQQRIQILRVNSCFEKIRKAARAMTSSGRKYVILEATPDRFVVQAPSALLQLEDESENCMYIRCVCCLFTMGLATCAYDCVRMCCWPRPTRLKEGTIYTFTKVGLTMLPSNSNSNRFFSFYLVGGLSLCHGKRFRR